ncbi:hypothetical protein V5O48_011956 [Marasmius crinis-equi]|uniref:F-box domain-containing protein n=1 Tax=Marasmius crinis-equi TaxID=585013 RepID=A0ABR3F446_9AGAR
MRVSRFDFQEIKDLSFPDLESFVEEEYLHDTRIEDILWFWQAIREAPKLTRVSSWSVNRMLPYSQLTWLELRYVDEDDLRLLFEVLPSCTRLQSLELWIFRLNGGAEPISLETVEISSLRELAVRELNGYDILHDDPILVALFTSLAMPSLASFTLSCCGWPESLSTLAKRSPLLRRVQLNNPDVDDVDISSTIDSLNSFLYSLPYLMQLELHMATLTTWKTSSCVLSDGLLSTLLSGLRLFPNRPSHLPKLDTIRLRLPDVTLDTKVVEEVLEVVKHRHSESSPMKQISVYRHGEKVLLQPATVGRIREVELACDAKIVIKEWTEGEGLWISDSTPDST